MAKVLVNRAKMSTSTTGTGTITLGSAVAGFQSFEGAGVVNSDVVRYVIEDGDYWEIGTGTYTSSGKTLTRTVTESSNADQAISLSGSAFVFIAAAANDFVQLDGDEMTGDLSMGDNVKIKLGDGDDFEIVHNGSDSIINDAGTGSIKLQTSGNTKLEVTTGGITVTGAVTGDLTGDVTGNVTGNVTGDVTGNADTAAALETSRTISLTGDVTGSTTFDGSANVSISATVGDDSHDHSNATTSTDGFMSAADKTKLDGVETGATADQSAAEIKTAYESNSDTNAFTDALQTKLNAIEASADVTDTANVTAAGAVMDSELTDETAVKAINQGLATTDDVTHNSITSTTTVAVGSNASVAGYIDFTAIDHPTHSSGRVYYDTNHKTLSFQSDISGVEHELGIEEHVRVYNNTGATISKGKPVYWSGNSGGYPTVALANATSATKYNVQGLAAHDIADASYGYIIVSGLVEGFDTSGLNAGANFFAGLTDGALQNDPPSYPNYPMCLGWVISSHASTGSVLVNQQNHSVNSFRVQGDTHIGGDLTVTGDLQVDGTQTSTSSNNVSLGASFQYLNAGDTIGESGTTHTGSGLDDAYFSGHFTGTASTTYYVKIDGTGTPDTFSWSKDNFSTTEATGVSISASGNALDNGISIEWGATTGHTSGDIWSGTAAPANVDTGIFTNFNTGSSGTGYTHTGFFYDASTQYWTLAGEYDPEPSGTINTADASFVYGSLKAGTFIGDLTGDVTGDVTGTASTATALATARTISLTGDVSGSASFDGSANISITATVGDNSHDHDNATTSVDGFMSAADKTKLDGVEASADVTDATNVAAAGAAMTSNNLSDLANASTARTNLGLAIGTNVQAYDAQLADIAGLTPTDGNFIVGNGTNFVSESGSTARASLGLTIGTDVQAYSSVLANTTASFTTADETKLDGIEASADVTDATNVASAGAVMDGDFTANGLMKRTGAGTYSSITDNSSNWNTAYSWGDHSSAGYLTAHPSISAASSINNSGATVIQDVTLDSNGHVTSLASKTLSASDVGAASSGHTHTSSSITDLEEYVEDQIGANIVAGSNVSVSYNDTTGQTTISATDSNTTYAAGSGLSLIGTTFSHSDTSTQASVNNSGRTYIQDITLDTYGHITGITSATETVTNTDTNYYLSSASFNTGDGVLTLNRSGLSAVTVDLDGRYSTTDTNTTYSAGNGLSLSGTTFSMSGSFTGNFTASGNITAYSDERLKTNIETIDAALEKVSQMRGVFFDKDGVRQTGVIAQEMQKVMPEVVEDGEYLSVAYGNLIGVLIEAVKELKAEIDQMKG